MSKILIQKISITDLRADAVVNAANSNLWAGGGVCGYIFREAGAEDTTKACNKIGHCDVGSAVITPGFNSVGVQAPTELNAPRGCARIRTGICLLKQTRIRRARLASES